MDGIMDNNMVKRYPCRNYERLLAAEALPMTDELTKKLLWKGVLFYHYKPIEAYLKLRMYLILNKERKLARNSFILFLECIYT